MVESKQKTLGVFYTPAHVARFLVKWAVRKPDDLVLDPGAGEGVFVKELIEHFIQAGRSKQKISDQIYAIEYDTDLCSRLSTNLYTTYGIQPYIINADFFDVHPSEQKLNLMQTVPLVDAVVGNPPYIERQRSTNIENIRKKIVSDVPSEITIQRLMDIYGYFIIHAAAFLKTGGRLAFIVSDSWMNMDFGRAIKEFLLKKFKIKALIGFEERVFPEALVRAVLLLAEKISKKEALSDNKVIFVELRRSSELDLLWPILNEGETGSSAISHILKVEQSTLKPSEYWSAYLKTSLTYFNLIKRHLLVDLGEIANSGIGLFSLANEFYILDYELVQRLGIEKQFLRKIVLTPREVPLVIEDDKKLTHFVIYCDLTKEELRDTRLLDYIYLGENKLVSPRNKAKTVKGYHNLPRLKKAGRVPWYNVKTEIEKRCIGPILMPRRTYQKFGIVWNKALIPASDNFIVIRPKKNEYTVPLLAVLNSSLTEYFVRVRSQLYGGGVYDLRPDDVRHLPVLDLAHIEKTALTNLTEAYEIFLTSGDRKEIDIQIIRLLNLSQKESNDIKEELINLRTLSTTSKGSRARRFS